MATASSSERSLLAEVLSVDYLELIAENELSQPRLERQRELLKR